MRTLARDSGFSEVDETASMLPRRARWRLGADTAGDTVVTSGNPDRLAVLQST
jgi:hypothetical protein